MALQMSQQQQEQQQRQQPDMQEKNQSDEDMLQQVRMGTSEYEGRNYCKGYECVYNSQAIAASLSGTAQPVRHQVPSQARSDVPKESGEEGWGARLRQQQQQEEEQYNKRQQEEEEEQLRAALAMSLQGKLAPFTNRRKNLWKPNISDVGGEKKLETVPFSSFPSFQTLLKAWTLARRQVLPNSRNQPKKL